LSESAVNILNIIWAHQCVVFNHCELIFPAQSSVLCCEARDASEQFHPDATDVLVRCKLC